MMAAAGGSPEARGVRNIRLNVLALIGPGIAALGWTLVMTVFLVFIGLPLFIFGLAIAQAQES